MVSFVRFSRALVVFAMAGLLGGCNLVLMNPSGDVAVQQRDLIIASTLLMLVIIIPVMAATVIFAWRYRSSNTDADYDPDWHHSTKLEVLIWTAPLLIIIALGALTWISTHLLDPFRPLNRIDAQRPIAADVRPLEIGVVALDWKWMFIYPEQGIATVNELAAPIDRPIQFRLTSSSVMNSFFVPALAGQIYAMPGMETKLHAVINKEGEYEGFSANYSGSGFSKMNFRFHGLSQQGFDDWVAKAKAEGAALDAQAYLAIEKPSEREPVRYFSSVQDGLFGSIVNMCAKPGQMCMNEMMHIDAMGGGGKESHAARERLEYDSRFNEQGQEAPGATFPQTGREPKSDEQPQGMQPDSGSPDVNQGAPQQPDSGGGHQHNMPGHGSPAPNQLNDH
ncbi:ubiquinol oxidase subunit II [Terrihabitans sp. B22-R8]|uniref:ubiquinol oxidase subunit II n=1 Tax=Terrihabitans sp. B22-R8 TaxID=3425128 RepID=UPI00403C6EB1